MLHFIPWLKRNFLLILVLVIIAVFSVSWIQAQKTAQNICEANTESKSRLVASHRMLAAALEGNTLSLEMQLQAVQECAVIRRELASLGKHVTSEKKWLDLVRYYDSMEDYLTKTLTGNYLDCPRSEAVSLTQKDQSIVSFIRNASAEVGEMLTNSPVANREMIDIIHSVIGERFEATFHTFDRNDFFRREDPLEAFFA